MITEDYVSFEIAKLLKDKGFNGPCFAYYSEFVDNWKTLKLWKRYPKTYDTVRNDGYLLVPTLQTAMKWLREVHGISIEITSIGYLVDYDVEWECDIKAAHKLYFKHITGEKSFESCANEAIKYCIVNLI